MPSFSDLPLEVHELILKYQVSMMTGYMFDSGDGEKSARGSSSNLDTDTDMMEQDTEMFSNGVESPHAHSTYSDSSSVDSNDLGPWPAPQMYTNTFFPYNVASTCMLWYKILTQIPQCWINVVFDVAESPSRFLDVFKWSQNLPIQSVFVYSSHARAANGLSDPSTGAPLPWLTSDYGNLERSRVNDIMEVLCNNIDRCKRVMFHVMFTGCLPSPLYFMMENGERLANIEILVLRAAITNNPSFPVPPHPDQINFNAMVSDRVLVMFPPLLASLDISGGWFMELVRNKHTSPLFRMEPPQHISCLKIRHFGFGRAVNTIALFLSAIAGLNVSDTLHFSDLRRLSPKLDDDMTVHAWPSKPTGLLRIKASTIAFADVARGFLVGFNAIAQIHATQEVSFAHCEIPFITHPYTTPFLVLSHIQNGHSLKNALCSWWGNTLLLDNCYFDDDFLSWLLQPMVNMRLPACNMTKLAIVDCPGFTASSLIGLLIGRSLGVDSKINTVMPPYTHLRIKTLAVKGKCPDLTPVDKASLGRCTPFMESVFWSSPTSSRRNTRGGRLFDTRV